MKLIKLQCPACGASFNVDADHRSKVFCQYCGSPIILDNESININLNYIDVAKVKEADFNREVYQAQQALNELEYRNAQQEYEQWRTDKYLPWKTISIYLSTIPFAIAFLLYTLSEKMHIISDEGKLFTALLFINLLLWTGGVVSLSVGYFIMRKNNPMVKYNKKKKAAREEELRLKEKKMKFDAKYNNNNDG